MVTRDYDDLFLRLQAHLAGRFSLEREIGRGGMGVVYLARDVALERPVAIKVLSPALSAQPNMRQRFLREARVAAQCFHPHIVPIHAVEEADDLAWIVMAYVRGETLADLLRRAGPLPADDIRTLAREVGWALSYAHQRGVVHRDIKPENLLIDASTGRYVIADFGIAHLSTQSITPTGGTVAGTARYMAPEQALGEPIDGRADLYALGVTLFLAATGRAPFDGTSAMALVLQHATQPAPSVRQGAPTLPLALARAVDRCLAKQPDARFADAEHFLAAIAADVRAEPMPPTLLAMRNHADSARTLIKWAAVTAVSTGILIAGEPADSFGREVFMTMGSSMSGLFVFAAGVRAAEAWLDARRQLRRGHAPADVTRAFGARPVTEATDLEPLPSRRIRGLALSLGGVCVGLAQGGVTRWFEAPPEIAGLSFPSVDWLSALVQVSTALLPPLMIARGMGSAVAGTRWARWVQERVTSPIAELATRLALRGVAGSAQQSLPSDAPTEVLLLRAVESAVGALPAAQRVALGDAQRVAQTLAGEAAQLRAREQALDAREAEALVMPDPTSREQALRTVREEREDVRSRLTTAVAALESLRLDLLRVAQEPTDGALTAALADMRGVQHQIDAALEVRQLLKAATPT